MNFLFHTISLTSSGGSRVITNLSNYLAEAGHQVSIVIDRNRVAFPLHKNVKVYHLKTLSLKDVTPALESNTSQFEQHLKRKQTKKSRQNKPKLREQFSLINNMNQWKKYLLKLVTFPTKYLLIQKFLSQFKPDKIASHNMYSFLEHYFFYPKDKFRVVLHNSPKEVFVNRGVKHILPIKAYFQNRSCISVSDGVLEEMKELMPFISANSKTIYNPFDFEDIRHRSEDPIDEFYLNNKYILSVSSLAPGKRVERIIHAFYQLDDLALQLVILGVGEEEQKLKMLVDNKGLQERVHFVGFIPNPMPYMKNAECLVLASDSEGLPTVLIEALVCGTPVVSTNCKTGPSEILTGYLQPFLVDIESKDESQICGRLSDAIGKASQTNIDNHVINIFSKDVIVQSWQRYNIVSPK